jgi:uncharacterized YigZ family protein
MTNEQDFFFTIAQNATAEFKDRGSQFIAFAYPVSSAEECKTHIKALKKEHLKAVHHCFAYRIGITGDNFRSSDDGEPSGSAGKPILNQIDSKELTDTLVVVVRYFGGILLGVPGLINAYKTSASLCLQMTPIIQRNVEVYYGLQFDHAQMNDIMSLVKQYNCTAISREVQLFCFLKIGIPKARLEEMLYKLADMHTVAVKKSA